MLWGLDKSRMDNVLGRRIVAKVGLRQQEYVNQMVCTF